MGPRPFGRGNNRLDRLIPCASHPLQWGHGFSAVEMSRSPRSPEPARLLQWGHGFSAVEGVVILEFPTFDEAKAWYDSPAYREVRENRFRGADYRAVIVEGV